MKLYQHVVIITSEINKYDFVCLMNLCNAKTEISYQKYKDKDLDNVGNKIIEEGTYEQNFEKK